MLKKTKKTIIIEDILEDIEKKKTKPETPSFCEYIKESKQINQRQSSVGAIRNNQIRGNLSVYLYPKSTLNQKINRPELPEPIKKSKTEVRLDAFGNPIVKGGNHKIAFKEEYSYFNYNAFINAHKNEVESNKLSLNKSRNSIDNESTYNNNINSSINYRSKKSNIISVNKKNEITFRESLNNNSVFAKRSMNNNKDFTFKKSFDGEEEDEANNSIFEYKQLYSFRDRENRRNRSVNIAPKKISIKEISNTASSKKTRKKSDPSNNKDHTPCQSCMIF